MLRRLVAALIDLFLGFIPLFIICNMFIYNITGASINTQVAPLISFQLILSPFSVVTHVIEYPLSLGIDIIQTLFAVVVVFLSEVLLYTVFELSPMKRTVGKYLMRIGYKTNLTFSGVLLRNSVKVLTRYLLCLPLIFVFLFKNGCTLHDKLAGSSIIEKN